MKDKAKIQKFEDMPVWHDAQDFAVSIYKLTKKFPKSEIYGLTSQMQRASSSISANIAEGFGRTSVKDKAHFYSIAYGSLLEVKNFVYLVERLNYIESGEATNLIKASNHLQRQINAISSYLKSRNE